MDKVFKAAMHQTGQEAERGKGEIVKEGSIDIDRNRAEQRTKKLNCFWNAGGRPEEQRDHNSRAAEDLCNTYEPKIRQADFKCFISSRLALCRGVNFTQDK